MASDESLDAYQHVEAVLTKMREAYQSGKPVMEEILTEHERAMNILNMYKLILLFSPDTRQKDTNDSHIENFAFVISHCTKMLGMLTAMHGLAMSINAIMSEHTLESEHRHS